MRHMQRPTETVGSICLRLARVVVELLRRLDRLETAHYGLPRESVERTRAQRLVAAFAARYRPRVKAKRAAK